MPLGITRDHHALTTTMREWAESIDGTAAIRSAEHDAEATVAKVWAEVTSMGLTAIVLPETEGGGGSDLVDQAIALEAAARGLVPGPLLVTSVVGSIAARVSTPAAAAVVRRIAAGERAAIALDGSVRLGTDRVEGTVAVAVDATDADWLLVCTDERAWLLVPCGGWSGSTAVGLDLSTRAGGLSISAAREHVVELTGVDDGLVAAHVVTLAAAEASGLASWCLDTAVEYAKVREQFGAPIGSFQAVKHLCSAMLETTESIAAAAWDAATVLAEGDDADAISFAVDVAATVAFSGAVQVAQDCVQVLGGIGFTFEHDAHLYLRRAIALRAVVGAVAGRADQAAARLTSAAATGRRRELEVDFAGADEPFRSRTRAALAEIAALPEHDRRGALVDAGYLMPHLAAPYGLGAGPVEQVVIDAELVRAGLQRPDLKIGGWAVPTIIAHGTDAQRERFVRPTLEGAIVWCQLFSEPGAGSDLASLSTRAERVDGGWSLTGQKVWTSLAHEADWAICLARTNREVAKHRGITFFLVDMRSEGLEVRPLREMTGDAMFNEVFLDGVLVPDDCVVGEVDAGWNVSRTTLSSERVAMAGTKLGVSTERAVALAAGRPDAVVRVGHQVALATVCQLIGVRATLRSIAGRGPGPESSVAKLLGVRNRQEASDLVGELLGPRILLGGQVDVDADVHEMLLTRCLSIAGGTTQVLRNVVAERVLGLPR
ncbi:MAG TPA: acyl-CoA dehydrogenase [Aeromicrobium sp.]|nr:acyl-CoA dehydrogenase [Aeromicrobium sp.]